MTNGLDINTTNDLIWEDDFASLAQADFCTVPGYLVLRTRIGVQSLGELDPTGACKLGGLLAAAVAAIEATTRADRVYCLSFCEVDRNLHFHLFPRTAALLMAYQEASGTTGQPVNGPLLFEWARDVFVPGSSLPAGWPPLAEVCDQLRARLRKAKV